MLLIKSPPSCWFHSPPPTHSPKFYIHILDIFVCASLRSGWYMVIRLSPMGFGISQDAGVSVHDNFSSLMRFLVIFNLSNVWVVSSGHTCTAAAGTTSRSRHYEPQQARINCLNYGWRCIVRAGAANMQQMPTSSRHRHAGRAADKRFKLICWSAAGKLWRWCV